MAKLPWKPWHEVVKLRDDLRSGELPMHMFAADLYEVMMQRGKRPIYEKPEHFFALTFPTPTCAIWCGTWCCGWRARTIKLSANWS
ncbi:MAG: hypothetical protein IPP35_07875 [Elusimicrobia bacterium]|nr:hypothetical protein [Elusimicrobiota bacterium]